MVIFFSRPKDSFNRYLLTSVDLKDSHNLKAKSDILFGEEF